MQAWRRWRSWAKTPWQGFSGPLELWKRGFQNSLRDNTFSSKLCIWYRRQTDALCLVLCIEKKTNYNFISTSHSCQWERESRWRPQNKFVSSMKAPWQQAVGGSVGEYKIQILVIATSLQWRTFTSLLHNEKRNSVLTNHSFQKHYTYGTTF